MEQLLLLAQVEQLLKLELDLPLVHLIQLYLQQPSDLLPKISSPVGKFPHTLSNNLPRVLLPCQLMYSLFQIQQIEVLS
jgi:hypothetical protein